MLNVFPELATYSLAAPLILRLTIGIFFIILGKRELSVERSRWRSTFKTLRLSPLNLWIKTFGVAQIIGGVLLIIGAWTQAAALFFAIVSLGEMFLEYREPALLKRDLAFYTLLFVISLSLLFSGAGFFGLDLPGGI